MTVGFAEEFSDLGVCLSLFVGLLALWGGNPLSLVSIGLFLLPLKKPGLSGPEADGTNEVFGLEAKGLVASQTRAHALLPLISSLSEVFGEKELGTKCIVSKGNIVIRGGDKYPLSLRGEQT